MTVTDRMSLATKEASQRWLSGQNLAAPISSNKGSGGLPFQRWFHFKEAFSPAFVRQSIDRCDYQVNRILDPFGGSGTTSLTARMHGIDSVSIEVNPFLADLARAKITPLSPSAFSDCCRRLTDELVVKDEDYAPIKGGPKTLVEPGVKGRYVYSRDSYGAIRALNRGIASLPEAEARLGRVLLGSILVECSNVHVNGKGRRYRRNWKSRVVRHHDVIDAYEAAIERAIEDLVSFRCYSRSTHKVYNDDARRRLQRLDAIDLAVFSPPYPNSFDYTDVYNLELWMLGYLTSFAANRKLRQQTLRSHVQVKWANSNIKLSSPTLAMTYEALDARRGDLWGKAIPEMVVGYFNDLSEVLGGLSRIIPPGQHAVAAVGDSQYAGIKIDVPQILAEIAQSSGFEAEEIDAIRSMRSSAQHGGALELSETAIRFRRTN